MPPQRAFYSVHDQSVMRDIRRFHNSIKYRLLWSARSHVGSDGASLLDLGAGRGGDVHKWQKLGFDRVTAVDVDATGLEELRRRSDGHETRIRCLHQSMAVPVDDRHDVVTAMFSIHCVADDLDVCVGNVANVLGRGGIFIVTCVDGTHLSELLQCGDVSFAVRGREFCRYRGRQDGRVDVRITCISTEERIEQLIAPHTIIRTCARHGLGLACLNGSRSHGSFVDFGGRHLSSDEQAFSFLNHYMTFAKI